MAMPNINDIVYMAKDVGPLRVGDTVIVREVALSPNDYGETSPYPVVVEPHGMLIGQEERAIPLNMPVTLDEITEEAPVRDELIDEVMRSIRMEVEDAVAKARDEGYAAGEEEGRSNGYEEGWDVGYQDGKAEAND